MIDTDKKKETFNEEGLYQTHKIEKDIILREGIFYLLQEEIDTWIYTKGGRKIMFETNFFQTGYGEDVRQAETDFLKNMLDDLFFLRMVYDLHLIPMFCSLDHFKQKRLYLEKLFILATPDEIDYYALGEDPWNLEH